LEKCKILNPKTTHNIYNLTSYYFKQSFNTIPIQKHVYPPLNLSTLTSATFNTPLPFEHLYKLADQSEQNFIQLNNTSTNPKRLSYFFYCYLKAYFESAATNNEITKLNLKEALNKISSKTSDPQILARIIAYYDITQISKPTITQLKKNLNKSYLDQANQYIIKKLKIVISTISETDFIHTFNISKIIDKIDDSLFF
jgi:hypothetical protein